MYVSTYRISTYVIQYIYNTVHMQYIHYIYNTLHMQYITRVAPCRKRINLSTGWRIFIGRLNCIGHFPQKSPIIGSSLAERDMRLKVSYALSPPCTCALPHVIVCQKRPKYIKRDLNTSHEIPTTLQAEISMMQTPK